MSELSTKSSGSAAARNAADSGVGAPLPGLRAASCMLTFLLLLCWCSAACAQSNAPQLKVIETIWGFNGRVQPGQFNPLSILLDNQTADAVDGVFTLQEMRGALTPSGGQHVQQAFLAPAGRRWIQFYPYVTQTYQATWQLTFHDGDRYRNRRIAEVMQARSTVSPDADSGGSGSAEDGPQVIILDDAETMTRRPPTVDHFPENIFPPYVTATTGLQTVFLDHDPDWELPRQQSFLSWLKLGGSLQLLHDSRGEFPRFSGELAELNQPLNRFRYGSGVVVRHNLKRDALTEQVVRSAVVVEALQGSDEELRPAGQEFEQLTYLDAANIDNNLFRQMRELTLPDHSWGLIFFLALCYIGLIFPGCFLVSRQKQLHFLATYGAIIGLSLIFSFLFLMIGQRGYGESTTLHTMAIARAEDASHWNVMQWNALFVTSGDNYTASVSDQQVLFSVADTTDRVSAQTAPGNRGEARMRIPPFSALTFLNRRRVAAEDWQLSIVEADVQVSGVVGLTIQTGDSFPTSPATKYMVIAGRNLYDMKLDTATKRLTLFGAKRRIAKYCEPRYDYSYGSNPWGRAESDDQRSAHELFYDQNLPSLVQRSLLDDLVYRPMQFELPPDRIRLLVYTEIPDTFAIDVSAPANRSGRILFTKDLSLQRLPADP